MAGLRFVDELETVTEELLRSDPQDGDRVAALMERRAEAITALPAALGAMAGGAGADVATRLQAVFDRGVAFEETLTVARAAARQQLAGLYRAGFHTRALSAGQAEHHGALSLEA